ncbi:MAG: YdeI/OmpD-associated family protein [Desulfobulbus sp.]
MKRALEDVNLTAEYKQRPPYQNNDYLDWIGQAKQKETKDRRLKQMLIELRSGTRTWGSRGTLLNRRPKNLFSTGQPSCPQRA